MGLHVKTIDQFSSHWVGDGFPVRSIFTYNDLGRELNPFILMDYAGPYHFEPIPASTHHRRGVGVHPHQGFETVTIVYQGQVEHRDSTGAGGVITKGDVQWMTAGRGLTHEEYHGAEFSHSGGVFEVIQLWVNLPREYELTNPRYQDIRNAQIPRFSLGSEGSYLRVISGSFDKLIGAAQTFFPIDLWDVQFEAKQVSQSLANSVDFTLTGDQCCAIFLMTGSIEISSQNNSELKSLAGVSLAIIEASELEHISIKNTSDNHESRLLIMRSNKLMGGIFGRGPFVLSSSERLYKAFEDFQNGLF